MISIEGKEIVVSTSIDNKDLCKTIISARWDKKTSTWRYPLGAWFDVYNTFRGIDDFTEECKAEFRKLHLLEKGVQNLKDTKEFKHLFLMSHQTQSVDIARNQSRYLFALDTGTGKTLTALEIMDNSSDKKWLVICPKALIKSAWVEDAEKFYPHIKILPLSRNMSKKDYQAVYDKWEMDDNQICRRSSKDELKEFLAQKAEIIIINPESFKGNELIYSLGIEGLVIDESTIIKNGQSAITKEVIKFTDTLSNVYLLSGLPAPNGVLDYWSQMRVIDPAILGASYFKFRDRYFESDWSGFNWIPKTGAIEEIMDRISRKMIMIKKEDCLDLPEKTYITRHVELSKEQMKYYKTMEKEQILLLSDHITASNKLTCMMKLRQITSGFIMDMEGNAVEFKDKAKLKELSTTLHEISGQVIIWCQFKKEIEQIEEMLGDKCVTAYSKTKNTDESIRKFKHGEVQYIVAHPATLKFGVTFVQCTYAVYYSMDYNLESYYQSHDRIYRKGQTKPCTFISLVVPSTIDEIIWKSQRQKKSDNRVMDNLLRGEY